MRIKTMCNTCKSSSIQYLGNGYCYCYDCGKHRKVVDKVIETPYERTRRMVYSTGNRWMIENFEATH